MSRIIVFGCGGVGIKVFHKLLEEGNEVISFANNSQSKWGTCCEGRKVISPEKILQEEFDYVAIGLYKAVQTIKKQLRGMGIRDEQIIVPMEPDRIFPCKRSALAEKIESLEKGEYISQNTQAYRKLNIQIKDSEFLRKLDSLKATLAENNIPREKVCIVSGAVLQAFGLRESKEFDDIDIIMTDDLRRLYGRGLVIVSDVAEMHIQNHYNISDDCIINELENHFVFSDFKFMHPSILYEYGREINSREYELLERYCNLGRD